MSGGLITPETGGNLIVSDSADVDRVIIGRISEPSESNPTGDYGLKVTSSDGATTIIDGTSNILKIQATGTMYVSALANATTASTTDLTALGTMSTTPAHICYIAPAASASSRQNGMWHFETTGVSSTTLFLIGRMSTSLSGSTCRVTLEGINSSGVAADLYGRYYVFIEAAL